MVFETLNDNADARAHGPDAHGQAAMLLVESLIHGLIALGTITLADAVEVVDTATEVKADIADDLGDSPANVRKSIDLLNAIRTSLSRDLPE